MKLFKREEILNIENLTPGEIYRSEILTDKDRAKDLGGIFGLLEPGCRVPYHYHNKRESIIVVVCGEAKEIVEGEEFLIKADDVLFIPAGEKHSLLNNTDKDFQFIESWTYPSDKADFVEV